MKKLTFSTLAYMLTALCAAVLLISCSDDNNSPATYAVVVTAGTGGTASADKTNPAESETVTLTAAVTEPGYTFKQWTVTSGTITLLPNAEANPAAFVMPAGAVSVKAEFLAPGEAYGIEAVKIPAGTFQMGSPDSDGDAYSDEKPQHWVKLTQDFYMRKYQVTREQYAAFLNDAGVAGVSGVEQYVTHTVSGYGTQNLFYINQGGWTPLWNDVIGLWEADGSQPMIYVTWYGAKAYADWVGGTLPTEAQWEYACRAGTTTPFYFGDAAAKLGDYGWSWENSQTIDGPSPVGMKLPNGYGLYDMHGNVFEWCLDQWDGSDNYPNAATEDVAIENPLVGAGYYRVLRGGSWINNAQDCRSAFRDGDHPGNANINIGFRVVFVQ